jgi:sulfur carrier protein ThiS adenylyltransferase
MAPTVIGVGALGRPLALMLAAIGVPRLTLIDFDAVDESNLTTQGYRRQDLGRLKVEALAQAIGELDPAIEVTCVPDRFRPRRSVSESVFCCVDSIETRTVIWKDV